MNDSNDTDPPAAGRSNRTLLISMALGALGALAATSYATYRRRAATVSPTERETDPGALPTWEGEGGGVPVGAGRTAASRVRARLSDLETIADPTAPAPRGVTEAERH